MLKKEPRYSSTAVQRSQHVLLRLAMTRRNVSQTISTLKIFCEESQHDYPQRFHVGRSFFYTTNISEAYRCYVGPCLRHTGMGRRLALRVTPFLFLAYSLAATRQVDRRRRHVRFSFSSFADCTNRRTEAAVPAREAASKRLCRTVHITTAQRAHLCPMWR